MKPLAIAPGMSFVAKFLEWLAAPMLFLWLATAFVGLFMMAGAAERPYDEELGDLAFAVASRVEPTGKDDSSLRLAADAQRWLATDRIDQLNYAIRRVDGVLLAGEAGGLGSLWRLATAPYRAKRPLAKGCRPR
jgi:two-component system sensor histidine kinase TctE